MKNQYYLLGKKLSHSISPLIHEIILEELNIIGKYDLLEIEEDEIKNTIKRLENNEFIGCNVTIPYKEKVLSYVSSKSDEVRKIKATNTLFIKNGKVRAENTDAYGFTKLLEKNGIIVEDKTVLILGTGGASKCVNYVLSKLSAKNIFVFSRNDVNSEKDNETNNKTNNKTHNEKSITTYLNYSFIKDNEYYEKILKKVDIVINATPLGMYPKTEKNPLDLFNDVVKKRIIEESEVFIDLIYNPSKTCFLKSNKHNRSYNGLDMLIYQAIYAQKLWNNIEINESVVDKIYKKIKNRILNKSYIIIGNPNSGKSTILKEVEKKILNLKCKGKNKSIVYIDMDDEIERRENSKISDLFKISEDYFRKKESDYLKELAEGEDFKIIASGGGIIKSVDNLEVLKNNFNVIFLNRDLKLILSDLKNKEMNNRPLFKSIDDVINIYNERLSLYEKAANYKVNNNNRIDDAVDKIINIMKENGDI